MSKEEKYSTQYINDLVSNSRDYPLCKDDKVRRKAMTVGLTSVKKAYKNGYRKALDEVAAWIAENLDVSSEVIDRLKSDLK